MAKGKTKKSTVSSDEPSVLTSQKGDAYSRKSSSDEVDAESIVKKKKVIAKKEAIEEEATGLLKDEDPEAALTPIFLFLRNMTPILKLAILLAIMVLSFSIRVFSIFKFESVIHEYDPWF